MLFIMVGNLDNMGVNTIFPVKGDFTEGLVSVTYVEVKFWIA